jgi:hypothetical protein
LKQQGHRLPQRNDIGRKIIYIQTNDIFAFVA